MCTRPYLMRMMDEGQTESYRLVHKISTDKRACICWSAQLSGGRLLRSYRRKSFAVTRCMVGDRP